MGVYSSAFAESALDNQVVDLLDESIDISTTPSIEENGFGKLIAETEANYTMFMKAVGICELAAAERDGDVIYEAADVSGFFGKVKQFFKNILEKIKRLFKKFLVNFDSWTKSNKDFVEKYKKQIIEAKTNDFEYEGYKFSHVDTEMKENSYETFAKAAVGAAKVSVNGFNVDDVINKAPDMIVTSVKSAANTTTDQGYKDIMAAKTQFDEKYDDAQEAIRGQALSMFGGATTAISSDDFSEEIFKLFHNNETSKETLSGNDIDKTSFMSDLINYEKVKKNTENAYKKFDRGINDYIKALEKAENTILKEVPQKDASGNMNTTHANLSSIRLAYIGIANRIMKDAQQYCQQIENGRLQALKERAKQSKAILTKLITRKVKEDADMSGADEFGVTHARTALDSVNFI